MRPALLCPGGHLADVPTVRSNPDDVGGAITCSECHSPMSLITYGIVTPEADWLTVSYDERRARGTWWQR